MQETSARGRANSYLRLLPRVYVLLPSTCTDFCSNELTLSDILIVESDRNAIRIGSTVVVGIPVVVDIARVRRVAGVR